MKYLILLACVVSFAAAGVLNEDWLLGGGGARNRNINRLGRVELTRDDLLRQKFLLEVLQRVEGPLRNLDASLVTDESHYIGDIDSEMRHIIELSREGRILGKNTIYTVMEDEHLRQLIGLCRLLCHSRDWETFQRNVLYMRHHVNDVLFVNALLLAIRHRDDTQRLIVPAIHEILPELYVDRDLVGKIGNMDLSHLVDHTETRTPNLLDLIGLKRQQVSGVAVDRSQLWMPWREMRREMAIRRMGLGKPVVSVRSEDKIVLPMRDSISDMGILTEDIGLKSWLHLLLNDLSMHEGRMLGVRGGILRDVRSEDRIRGDNWMRGIDRREHIIGDDDMRLGGVTGLNDYRRVMLGDVRGGRLDGTLPMTDIHSDRLVHMNRRRLHTAEDIDHMQRLVHDDDDIRHWRVGGMHRSDIRDGRHTDRRNDRDENVDMMGRRQWDIRGDEMRRNVHDEDVDKMGRRQWNIRGDEMRRNVHDEDVDRMGRRQWDIRDDEVRRNIRDEDFDRMGHRQWDIRGDEHLNVHGDSGRWSGRDEDIHSRVWHNKHEGIDNGRTVDERNWWNMDRNINRDMDRNMDLNMHRDMDRNMNRDMHHGMERNMDLNMHRDMNRNIDRDMHRDIHLDMNRDMHRDMHRDMSINERLGHGMDLKMNRDIGMDRRNMWTTQRGMDDIGTDRMNMHNLQNRLHRDDIDTRMMDNVLVGDSNMGVRGDHRRMPRSVDQGRTVNDRRWWNVGRNDHRDLNMHDDIHMMDNVLVGDSNIGVQGEHRRWNDMDRTMDEHRRWNVGRNDRRGMMMDRDMDVKMGLHSDVHRVNMLHGDRNMMNTHRGIDDIDRNRMHMGQTRLHRDNIDTRMMDNILVGDSNMGVRGDHRRMDRLDELHRDRTMDEHLRWNVDRSDRREMNRQVGRDSMNMHGLRGMDNILVGDSNVGGRDEHRRWSRSNDRRDEILMGRLNEELVDNGLDIMHNLQQLVARLNIERIALGLHDGDDRDMLQSQRINNERLDDCGRMALRMNEMRQHSRLNRNLLERINDIERRLQTVIQREVRRIVDVHHLNVDIRSQHDVDRVIGEIMMGNVEGVGIMHIIREILLETEQIHGIQTLGHLGMVPLNDPMMLHLLNRLVRIVDQSRQERLGMGRLEDIRLNGVTINDVKVDRLITRIDDVDSDLVNLLGSRITQEGLQKMLVGRQRRLNHKDFEITVDIDADRSRRVVMRTLLVPRVDGNGHILDIETQRLNTLLLDTDVLDLQNGRNSIRRLSRDILWTARDTTLLTDIYRTVMMGLDGKIDMMHLGDSLIGQTCRFPHRLLLPRGTVEGLQMQLVVVITPLEDIRQTVHSGIGDDLRCLMGVSTRHVDDLPLLFPLDRRIDNIDTLMNIPNVHVVNVKIRHE